MPDVVSVVSTLIHLTAIVISLWLTLSYTGNGRNTGIKVFFSFALLSMLASDIYWIAYFFISPDVRMPFAVNEIGEAAFFLLLASCIKILLREREQKAHLEMLLAAVFTVAEIALWIIWTGEWLEDILGGLPILYFFCLVVKLIKSAGTFTSRAWAGFALMAVAVIAICFIALPIKGTAYNMLQLVLFLIVAMGELSFIGHSIYLMKTGADPMKPISEAFLALAWAISSMYLTEKLSYYTMEILCAVSIVLLAVTLKKVVDKYDLC